VPSLRTQPFSGTGIAINFYGEEGVEPARERRHELTRQDLNQHQVDFAIFATRNPLSHGAILADELDSTRPSKQCDSNDDGVRALVATSDEKFVKNPRHHSRRGSCALLPFIAGIKLRK